MRGDWGSGRQILMILLAALLIAVLALVVVAIDTASPAILIALTPQFVLGCLLLAHQEMVEVGVLFFAQGLTNAAMVLMCDDEEDSLTPI
jgi:hypothetical protein